MVPRAADFNADFKPVTPEPWDPGATCDQVLEAACTAAEEKNKVFGLGSTGFWVRVYMDEEGLKLQEREKNLICYVRGAFGSRPSCWRPTMLHPGCWGSESGPDSTGQNLH